MWIITVNSDEGWERTEETQVLVASLDAELWPCCGILLRGAATKSLCAKAFSCFVSNASSWRAPSHPAMDSAWVSSRSGIHHMKLIPACNGRVPLGPVIMRGLTFSWEKRQGEWEWVCIHFSAGPAKVASVCCRGNKLSRRCLTVVL